MNGFCFLAGCIYTEWFDLDEPCSKGEVESVYVTNVFASRLGKYVSHVKPSRPTVYRVFESNRG